MDSTPGLFDFAAHTYIKLDTLKNTYKMLKSSSWLQIRFKAQKVPSLFAKST